LFGVGVDLAAGGEPKLAHAFWGGFRGCFLKVEVEIFKKFEISKPSPITVLHSHVLSV